MKTINYKGKGEHSVNELELIIEQQAEELHLLKSGQKQLPIHGVVVPEGTLKTKPSRKLKDFDVWYKPCERCGYDTGKSTKPKDGNKRCWKCGNFVQRDFTDRALKK